MASWLFDIRKTTCQLCNQDVRRGKTAEEFLLYTTALWKHLKQYHPDKSKAVEKNIEEVSASKKRKLETHCGKWSKNGEKSKEITRMIGEMSTSFHFFALTSLDLGDFVIKYCHSMKFLLQYFFLH